MRKDFYAPGDVLCDMHDAFYFLPDNLKVVSSISARTEQATELVTLLNGGKHPGNKYLVVIDTTGEHIVAAWSYDGRWFGLAKLKQICQAPPSSND